MKLLISGASGFIGRHVVQQAVSQGHQVTAIVRRRIEDAQNPISGLDQLVWDLSEDSPQDLTGSSFDCLIHLAASLAGTPDEQERTTIGGTERLLVAARQAEIAKLVGISSIAVVDYRKLPPMAVVDETAPAATEYRAMGLYAALKARQETLFRAYGQDGAGHCTILRPGLVYDETHLISAHAGIIKGPIRLLIEHEGQVPTVEVNGLARAIVDVAEKELPDGTVLHLADDNLPSQRQYLAGLRRRGLIPDGGILLPWPVASGLAKVSWLSLSAFGLAGKLPEALLPHAFASRFKPFRFANARAKGLIDWQPGGQFL